MVLIPPLSVLAPTWAPRAVAALLVAMVPPFSGQRRGRDLVLHAGVLQDGRCADLRRLCEGFGGLVVARGGNFADFAGAAQP